MLGAHPHLVCGPESHFFDGLADADFRDICRRADWPRKAVDALYSIEHVGDSIPANFGLARPELEEALAPREPSPASILSAMMDLYMRRHGKRRWCEKTPTHIMHVHQIRKCFPDSPIVRIVRDPRDVAWSMVHSSLPSAPATLAGAIARWRDYDESSARFFEVDPGAWTVRYEELVRDPGATLRELCRFIGEPFDPAMLDTSESARQVNAANEPWKAKVGERVDAARAEAWRRNFSEGDLRAAESIAGDRLRAYGYPVLGYEFPHPVEVHSLRAIDHYPEVIADLVARGARLSGPDGDRAELSLFLGDPNWWRLGTTRPTRLARTARLAWAILLRRAVGAPLAWFPEPGRSRASGFCATVLSWALPRPAARPSVPEFARPVGPA
jgi:hypothetical protein